MSQYDVSPNRAGEVGEIARLLSYILLLLASVGLYVSATAIPASRFEKLGAGAFPQFVFAGIILLSLIAIIDAVRKIPRAAYADFGTQTTHWVKRRGLVFICLAALAIYIALIPRLGFSIASFLFVFGLEIILMPRRPMTLLIGALIALAFSFGINGLFAEVFTVFLPRGGL
jgi:hypothetical protein